MNSIDPQLWGPSAWNFLYYVALSYPDYPSNDDIVHIKTFLLNLDKILPCAKCRRNYKDHIKRITLRDSNLSSRYKLVHWLIKLNNEINVATGKKLITYDDVLYRYLYKRDNSIYYKFGSVFIIIIIIFILILLVKYNQ